MSARLYVLGGTPYHAARRGKTTQKDHVLEAVAKAGPSGITREDVVKQTGVPVKNVSFYLNKLKKAGFVAMKGDANSVSPTMRPRDAAFAALAVLETALVCKAKATGITADMSDAFAKYQKLKALALNPATGGQTGTTQAEADVALRLATINLVKLVF